MTDHADLLRRLRVLRATGPANSPTDRICRDAALVIEQLQTEIAAALRERDADPDAPAPIELVTELDVRLHGVSRARPITPAATWRLLLDEVSAALRERDELARLLHVAEEAFDVDTKHAVATIDALRVRAETAEADLIAARHSRDEFHRLWERERVRAATAEADAALAWYWVDTLKDNTTCSEQRGHLEADQAAHRAWIAGADAE